MMSDIEADIREQVLAAVSRETAAKLDSFVSELCRWQSAKNLVGPKTLDHVWERHVLDSLQLLPLAEAHPGAWLDLGSGGGLPGVIAAIIRTEAKLGPTHLVEANGRKGAFLLHCVRHLSLHAQVHISRIETVMAAPPSGVSVVSARALAPLSQLLAWSNALLRKGALGIFPKGQDVEREMHEASTSWVYSAELHPSRTDPHGRILVVRMAQDARPIQP